MMDVNDEICDLIEDENGLVSDKIHNSKFAYLVIKHGYYNKLISSFAKFNTRVKQEIVRVKTLENKIVSFMPNTDIVIQKHLRELLGSIIEIDEIKPVFDVSKLDQLREGLVTADSQLTFLMKQNKVYSCDLLTKKLVEIE